MFYPWPPPCAKRKAQCKAAKLGQHCIGHSPHQKDGSVVIDTGSICVSACSTKRFQIDYCLRSLFKFVLPVNWCCILKYCYNCLLAELTCVVQTSSAKLKAHAGHCNQMTCTWLICSWAWATLLLDAGWSCACQCTYAMSTTDQSC